MLFRGAETHARSVLKAVSWRTLGTLDAFAISWFLTGRVAVAGRSLGSRSSPRSPGITCTSELGRHPLGPAQLGLTPSLSA